MNWTGLNRRISLEKMVFYFFALVISYVTRGHCLQLEINGVNIRYEVTRFGTCVESPAVSRLISVLNVSVNECLIECVVRPNCTGLSYKRTFSLCDLVTGNDNLKTTGNCLYIKRSDIVIVNTTCNGECDGEQICDQDGKCIVRVNSECRYPKVLYGTPSGNMFAAGDTQIIECTSGSSIYGSRTILCMKNGTWDSIPMCKKECNVSDFHNADVETISNSSGSYALVRCHTNYVSNRTESAAEETMGCANNGAWIPSIDCIYIDNLSNAAFNKPTSQSSTFRTNVAARATDGIWNPILSEGSCSHTFPSNEETAWLEVDLQQSSTIRRVKILVRLQDYFARRFTDVTLTIGNVSNPADICNVYVGPATSAEEVELFCVGAITGQFVRLSKPNTDFSTNLAICEIGIYEH